MPFRPGVCPHRDRAWAWLRGRWAKLFPGWELLEASDDAGPWRKGLALARALERATSEVVVVADADVWSDSVEEAVRLVGRNGAWVLPHSRVLRLGPEPTAAVLAGRARMRAFTWRRSACVEHPYKQRAAGGLVVLRRELARAVPMDPRFAGWGGEDHAWAYALTTLAGAPVRLEGPLFHLWHEPAPRETRALGSLQNEALRRRYATARTDAAAMRELVAEAAAALAADVA